MIHDETTVNMGRKDRKTNLEIKKPYTIVQYNKFMKGVDRADQYLCYYSVLRKTVKWFKKGGIVSAKLCTVQHIFCVQKTKYKQKSEVHELPAFHKSRIKPSQVLMTFNCQRSKQHKGGLNRTHQADSPRISGYTNWKKLLLVGREKEVSYKTV